MGNRSYAERTSIVGKIEDKAKDYLRGKYHCFLYPHITPKYPKRPKKPSRDFC